MTAITQQKRDKFCPPAKSDNASRWQGLLYSRFRGQAYPLTVFSEGVLSAASTWAISRQWLAAFRTMELEAGDRVVMALPPSPAFLGVLIAALWDGLSLAFLRPNEDLTDAITRLDARAGIGLSTGDFILNPDSCGTPDEQTVTARRSEGPPTPDVRFLMQTSGSTGQPRWIALSDENIFSVLDSHKPLLALEEARVLSVLPWNHAFGLMIDLLPALLAGAEIVRDPDNGREPERILDLMEKNETTHLCAVPMTLRKMVASERGQHLISNLRGGVVGGATIDAALANLLHGTNLRVGYGQTEASPGIALGKPGHFRPNLLGQPVGCQVRLDSEGEIHFRGRNACLGFWEEGGLNRLDPERWVATGDLARRDGKYLSFLGRSDASFKLNNGRLVQASLWENKLKERVPALEEVLIFSPDGERLEAYIALRPNCVQPSFETLRQTLGSLSERFNRVTEIAPDGWVHSPKGELCRADMLASLLIKRAA